jgi:hypothetical protein
VSDLEHVLFACDWPCAPDAAVASNISGFEAMSLTGAERHAIDRGNADRLLPRLTGAAVAAPGPGLPPGRAPRDKRRFNLRLVVP